MPTPLNYHHLYYFYTIAREGSVSGASSKLRVSQPSLSAQLKQFETYFGFKLFDRVGRKLLLTERGAQVLAYAETIFNTGQELLDSLADRPTGGTFRIQIGLSHSIPKAIAHRFLEVILSVEPRTHLTVHEERFEIMAEELRSHALDLVLSDVPARSGFDDLENHLAAEMPVLFCALPKIAAKYRRLPQDLEGAPLILPTVHSQTFHSIRDYFTAHRVRPAIVAEVQDVELALRLALSGKGIAPLGAAMLEGAGGKLAVIGNRKKPVVTEKIYVITRRRTIPHPLRDRILDALAKRSSGRKIWE